MTDLRDKILNANDIQSKSQTIPEWDCEIEIRGMSARQRGLFMAEHVEPESGKVNWETFYSAIVMICSYVPGTNEQIFKPGDLDLLIEKSGGVTERIAQIAMQLSGINREALEDAEKN